MKPDDEQYKRIVGVLPKQRGNVKIHNWTLLDALIYSRKNGCSWHDLPREFGNQHVIYTRFSRRAKNGVLERIHAALCKERL